MIYQPEKLDKYRQEAKELGYGVPAGYYDADIMELVRVCNGVGGQGSKLNPILNFAYRRYQGIAAPHDWGYDKGGTEDDKVRLDKEFLSNGLIRWRVIYGRLRWINPFALLDRNKLRLGYKSLRLFGYQYFNYHDKNSQGKS